MADFKSERAISGSLGGEIFMPQLVPWRLRSRGCYLLRLFTLGALAELLVTPE